VLKAEQVALHRGSQNIFEDLSFVVHPGHKVGLVGNNGAGKSTLFHLITGDLTSDGGNLSLPAGWRVVHMAQHVEPSERPALEFVIDGHSQLRAVEQQIAALNDAAHNAGERLADLHAEFQDLDGHRAAANAGEILHGLGFSAQEFSRPYREFSGGMRIRLNLAQALMSPSELLLLDEPTNHLDLETTVWLEGWLRRFAGTLILIAHDRSLLDGVCDQILHLENGRAKTYRGDYSQFERQRAAALTQRQAAYDRQQQEIRRMRAFVDRFRAKASKARQAQSRLKALQRMETVAAVHAQSPYRFSFAEPERMSDPLLRLDEVSVGYDGRAIAQGIRASVLPGDRIGILGANGAGKSTLLKCLVGELDPLSGELTRGPHAKVGYFAQHQLETLRADRTALETIANAEPGQTGQWHRDYLGGWGFPATLAERPVDTLSGGERARLVLSLIALQRPALLILDEPTNHLDLQMREALALAMQEFSGALIVVSHDRTLLDRVVDRFWLVADGTVSSYTDDLQAYATPTTPAGTPNAIQPSPPTQGAARRKAAAAQRTLEKPYREKVRRLESEMEEVAGELSRTESRLADTDTYKRLSPDELDHLLAQAGNLRKSLERLEREWLEASEALERLAPPQPD